jgi:AcrR family transcriptional regulator
VPRPRDPAIDAAVLDAVRTLLVEVGFAGTTVQAAARRAGVHPPAVYRRWPSRIALVEDAILSEVVEVPVVPTGDLHADLLRFLTAYLAMLERPAARAAVPGLLAAYQAGADVPDDRWSHLSVRPQLAAILHAAGADDADPDELLELVLATMVGRVVLPPLTSSPRPLARTVDLLVRAVGPPPTSGGRLGRRRGGRARRTPG